MKKIFILVNEEARKRAHNAINTACNGYIVTVSEPTRSLEQNAAQWPILEAFAQQKEACINGKMVKVTSEDWKEILSGAYNGEMRMAAFDNKVIMLPMRTSKMGKKAFSEWLEFLHAMAGEFGVKVYDTELIQR